MPEKNPFDFPFVLFKDKQNLPSAPGIYYVLNRSSNEIVYIGMSKNIRSRWKTHHRDWQVEMIDILYKDKRIVIAWEFCPIGSLEKIEKRRIDELKPQLNGLKLDETHNYIEEGDKWGDIPEYYLCLTRGLTEQDIPTTDLNYLRGKSYLLELINYRHSSTNRIVPRYRYFEQDCLGFYASNSGEEASQKYASDIYELLNDEFRAVMLWHLNHFNVLYKIKKPFITEFNAVYGVSLILDHLIDADIKATFEIVGISNYETAFLNRLDSDITKQTLTTIVRPVFRRIVKRNWLWIQRICTEDLENDHIPNKFGNI